MDNDLYELTLVGGIEVAILQPQNNSPCPPRLYRPSDICTIFCNPNSIDFQSPIYLSDRSFSIFIPYTGDIGVSTQSSFTLKSSDISRVF